MRLLMSPLNVTCALTMVFLPNAGRAAEMISTATVGTSAGWNSSGIWRTNGTGTGVTGPVAGNTYRCASNGVPFGNNLGNSRMRNLYAASDPVFQTFPGDSLTLNTNTELRTKRIGSSSGAIPTLNFPGVGGNPGLILNGGVLNGGDDGEYPIVGKIEAPAGTLSFICPGNNGAGDIRANRTFNIAGDFSGSGTMVIIQAGVSNPQRISGNANTFSGNWIVKAGWLQGVGTNSLGSGNIIVDPLFSVPLDPAAIAGITFANGPAIVEPMYDLNSPGTLTLVNGGQMRLHQICAFTAVSIEGSPLSAGSHSYAELSAMFPTSFTAGGYGVIVVQPYGPLKPQVLVQPLPKTLYAGATARFTVTAGPAPVTYQWRRGGVSLTDGGRVSGATADTLTIANVIAGDQGGYDVVVSNGAGSTPSSSVMLTIASPSGEPYEAAVLADNPAVFYQLNETTYPVGGTTANDLAGGLDGTYGTGVQNGNVIENITGPSSADGLPGFLVGNKAAQFLNLGVDCQISCMPWNLNTNTVTLTAWVNPNGPQSPSEGLVFCRGGGTVAGLNYSTAFDLLGNCTLGYTWNNEWETYSWNSGLVAPPGQWSLVALVVTPTNATIHVMNSNGFVSSTHPYAHVVQSFSAGARIGDDSAGASGVRSFNGRIDDVAVFKSALTKGQLAKHYYAASGNTNFAPLIGLQPVAPTFVYAGQTVQFTVGAGGSDPLTYQWKAGAFGQGVYTNLVEGGRFSGTTSPILTINNVAETDAADYVVTVANGFGTVTSMPASLTVLPGGPAENITLAIVQGTAVTTGWESPDWSDALPASLSAASKPGSTYECLAGSRLRTPQNPRTAVFPGNLLTLDGSGIWSNNFAAADSGISEIRFKQPNPGRVVFPKLVMNGGQLDAGNDGVVEIDGLVEVRTNAPIYSDSGNDRGYLISARLTGLGTIEYRGYNQTSWRSNYLNNLNIAGSSNNFSGKWNVVVGTLLGTGPNSLGTNDIAIGPEGALETTYDINNPNGTLFLSGRMYLHQNHTFKSLFVGGIPLAVGIYSFAELNAAYPANFQAIWMPQTGATNYTTGSGSITVLVQPAPKIVSQPQPLSLYPTETAQFSVTAQGSLPLYYTWRKGGIPLADGGNISGSATSNLTIVSLVSGNAGNYDVVVTNSIGSVTSQVAVLTILPTGPALSLALDYGGFPIIQAQGLDWNSPTNWSDGNPASLSAVANPGSTYRVVAGARLRSPAGSANSVFPGEVLTVDGDGIFADNGTASIGEIRFKHASPGTNYFKRLVMNGGQLDSGDNGLMVIAGRMDILANTPIYADSGASQDRPWQIDAWLTGNGSIEYHAIDTSFSGSLNITGTSNTFTGNWNIVQGALVGSGLNSLGSGSITIGANGVLETLYNVNSPTANLVLDGKMYLHQNDTFKSLTVGGVQVAAGTYTHAQLAAAFPANFPAAWTPLLGAEAYSTGSGSIQVLGTGVSLGSSWNGSTLTLTWQPGQILLEANEATGPWTTNLTATSPYSVTPTGARKFFRLQVP